MKNHRLCPICGIYPIDAGESDCGCIEEEMTKMSLWNEMMQEDINGQIKFSLEKEEVTVNG